MRKRRFVLPVIAALLAVNSVLFVAQPGLAVPRSVAVVPGALANYFFGPKMVRAEIIVKDGGVVHDYRIDQGRIRSTGNFTLTLLERDGTIVTVPVAADARITLNGNVVSFSALRPRMQALTVRDGDRPAERVRATWRR
jgi:hypothetical protein